MFAVRRFVSKDAALKRDYYSAPSTASRRHRELTFYYMWYDGFHAPRLTQAELKECLSEMIRMQQKMDLHDWMYLYKYITNRNFKKVCSYRVALLEGEQLTLDEWQFMYDHHIDADPYKAVCRAKIDELKAQAQQQPPADGNGDGNK